MSNNTRPHSLTNIEFIFFHGEKTRYALLKKDAEINLNGLFFFPCSFPFEVLGVRFFGQIFETPFNALLSIFIKDRHTDFVSGIGKKSKQPSKSTKLVQIGRGVGVRGGRGEVHYVGLLFEKYAMTISDTKSLKKKHNSSFKNFIKQATF